MGASKIRDFSVLIHVDTNPLNLTRRRTIPILLQPLGTPTLRSNGRLISKTTPRHIAFLLPPPVYERHLGSILMPTSSLAGIRTESKNLLFVVAWLVGNKGDPKMKRGSYFRGSFGASACLFLSFSRCQEKTRPLASSCHVAEPDSPERRLRRAAALSEEETWVWPESVINAFLRAQKNGGSDQNEGQVASRAPVVPRPNG